MKGTIFKSKIFRIITYLFLILFTFLISTFLFEKMKLYYEFWWLDIVMHIIGGFLFASLYISYSNFRDKTFNILHLFIFVIFIGVTWEVYEYIRDIYDNRIWGGILDTTKDLVDDTIGAYLAYILNKDKINNNKNVL